MKQTTVTIKILEVLVKASWSYSNIVGKLFQLMRNLRYRQLFNKHMNPDNLEWVLFLE